MKRVIAATLIIMMTGCATQRTQQYSGQFYKGSEVQQMQQVTTAKVLNIREITIQTDPGPIGTTVGSALGALGLLGFAGTGGNVYGMAAGVIAAAVLGGVTSDYVAKKLNESQAYEFTVALNNGRAMVITQSNVDNILVGDKVRITKSNDGTTRVYKFES